MNNTRSTTFYCFSPPVMLATFLIEIVGAIYIAWRYKITPAARLIIAILVCLGIFQGAEFLICGGLGVEGGTWSKLAYSATTLLPPLGIHLGLVIAGKTNRLLTNTAYVTAALFIAYFAFTTSAISGHTCYANYVVFSSGHGVHMTLLYSLYYYGWLLVGVWQAFVFARQQSSKHLRSALIALGVGYCAFIIPTTAVNIINPATLSAIPSIMCGFAVLLALVLIGRVAPDSLVQKNSTQLLKLRFPL